MDDTELVRFVEEQGGLATSAQIIAATDRKRFERAVAAGLLRRGRAAVMRRTASTAPVTQPSR